MQKKRSVSAAIILSFLLIFTSCSSKQANSSKVSDQKIEIIAHRGFGGQYPENTIYSAEQAVKLKVPIEFDVQFTEDGVMIVMHDDTVDRTTDGKGLVKNLKYSYIATLDAGKKISSKYSGQKVPKFTDYLETIKSLDYIYPELKSYRTYDDIVTFTKTLIDYGLENKCTIQAADYSKVLPVIRKISPKLKVAAICSSQKLFDNCIDIAKMDGNSMLSISVNIANESNLKTCKENCLDVSVWTIKDKDTLNKLINLGYKKFFCDSYFEINE